MTDQAHVLHLDPEAQPALAFALKRTMNDLAARAIVAECYDRELGSLSAADYRADIPRLACLLEHLGFSSPRPRAEGEVVRWVDGLYAIADGRPVRIGPLTPFRQLLRQAMRSGHVNGDELAAALALATTASLQANQGTTDLSTASCSSRASLNPR